MKCIENILHLKILEPQFIIKRFVNGDEEICDYEKYLTELINQCPNFMSGFSSPFEQIKEQSNGEPDAISGNYGIDYKLVASTSTLQSSSILSSQILKKPDGRIIYSVSKKTDGKIEATRLHAALRKKSTNELKRIIEKKHQNSIEKDITQFLNKLKIKKNILLFFPFIFWYDPPYPDIKDGISEMLNALKNDFKCSFQYRQEEAKDFDTFFATIYQKSFVLTKVIGDSFLLLDIIDLKLSNTYTLLLSYETERRNL